MNEKFEPQADIKFAESGGPDISYLHLTSSPENSAYEKARAAVAELDRSFSTLVKEGCLNGYRLALFGSAVSEPRPPTDLDVLVLVESVDSQKFDEKLDTFDGRTQRLFGKARFVVEQEDEEGEVFRVVDSSPGNFPQNVDFHLMSVEQFTQRLVSSPEITYRNGLDLLEVVSLRANLDPQARENLRKLRDFFAVPTSEGIVGADSLLEARRWLDETVSRVDYYLGKNIKMAFRGLTIGRNFVQNIVDSGAILVKGENLMVEGQPVFKRQDENFLS